MVNIKFDVFQLYRQVRQARPFGSRNDKLVNEFMLAEKACVMLEFFLEFFALSCGAVLRPF